MTSSEEEEGKEEENWHVRQREVQSCVKNSRDVGWGDLCACGGGVLA